MIFCGFEQNDQPNFYTASLHGAGRWPW